ncbi:hypothetical protein [Anabaena sp. CCY 9910]|uniref:hypothetical protein n=1 Tax=Anabaena sp. CCY 9910 TaxID=3103870 RepID=UPI0039E0ED60
MTEVAILAAIRLNNRSIYQIKQVEAQRSSDRTQEQTATILGYDTITGQFRVKDGLGKIFYTKAITNSGELSMGTSVSLVTPSGGGIPAIDAMPR